MVLSLRRLASTTAFALTTVILSTAPANAATAWRYVNSDNDNAKYYVDINSWRWNDDAETQVLFWLRGTNLTGYYPVRGRNVRSSVGMRVIDCEIDQIANGPATLYDSRGRNLQSWTTWGDWYDIVPDSVAEGWRDYVCEDYDAAQEW